MEWSSSARKSNATTSALGSNTSTPKPANLHNIKVAAGIVNTPSVNDDAASLLPSVADASGSSPGAASAANTSAHAPTSDSLSWAFDSAPPEQIVEAFGLAPKRVDTRLNELAMEVLNLIASFILAGRVLFTYDAILGCFIAVTSISVFWHYDQGGSVKMGAHPPATPDDGFVRPLLACLASHASRLISVLSRFAWQTGISSRWQSSSRSARGSSWASHGGSARSSSSQTFSATCAPCGGRCTTGRYRSTRATAADGRR